MPHPTDRPLRRTRGRDGWADLVATYKRGDLWFYKGTGTAAKPFPPRKKIGFGWGVYHQLTATGNIAGAKAGDLVARDKDGALWLYLGNGDGTFAQRIKVGGGWNEYSHIVGTGDANKDGRPDLYATHGPNRTAYFYAGTGNWRTPLREPLVHRSARRQSLRDRVRPGFLTRVGV
ncbi:FG-GAP repeat domain-containing protein, partial [Streptomyces sp. NPDC055912]|uniref:FG-GAP repeat domain-containing protein n=1 Tax=Streptomyces sp. NPDC055912 TaxID=3345660 RepID=UPI0035DC9190